jgi:hypothetical protein
MWDDLETMQREATQAKTRNDYEIPSSLLDAGAVIGAKGKKDLGDVLLIYDGQRTPNTNKVSV